MKLASVCILFVAFLFLGSIGLYAQDKPNLDLVPGQASAANAEENDLGGVRGKVWYDTNGNGIREEGEPPAEVQVDVVIYLLSGYHLTQTTTISGEWVLHTNYSHTIGVEVVMPSGFMPTVPNNSSDESMDSDVEFREKNIAYFGPIEIDGNVYKEGYNLGLVPDDCAEGSCLVPLPTIQPSLTNLPANPHAEVNVEFEQMLGIYNFNSESLFIDSYQISGTLDVRLMGGIRNLDWNPTADKPFHAISLWQHPAQEVKRGGTYDVYYSSSVLSNEPQELTFCIEAHDRYGRYVDVPCATVVVNGTEQTVPLQQPHLWLTNVLSETTPLHTAQRHQLSIENLGIGRIKIDGIYIAGTPEVNLLDIEGLGDIIFLGNTRVLSTTVDNIEVLEGQVFTFDLYYEITGEGTEGINFCVFFSDGFGLPVQPKCKMATTNIDDPTALPPTSQPGFKLLFFPTVKVGDQ